MGINGTATVWVGSGWAGMKLDGMEWAGLGWVGNWTGYIMGLAWLGGIK